MSATITDCKRLIVNGEASQTQNGEAAKARYLVHVTEKDADPLEVCRATFAGLPAYGNAYYSLNGLIGAYDKKASRAIDSRGRPAKNDWWIDVTWTKLSGYSGPLGNTANSQNISVKITSQSQVVYTQQALATINGAPNTPSPIRNAVDDLYPDPQEDAIYDTVIEVSYETDNIDHALWDASLNTINNDTVTMSLPVGTKTYTRTFPKHTLWLELAERSVVFSRTDPSVAKWRNDVKLVFRKDTWDKKPPQKGYRWLVEGSDSIGGQDGSGDVLTDWKDHPEYLDGDGFKLDSGAALVALDPQQTKFESDLGTLLGTI